MDKLEKPLFGSQIISTQKKPFVAQINGECVLERVKSGGNNTPNFITILSFIRSFSNKMPHSARILLLPQNYLPAGIFHGWISGISFSAIERWWRFVHKSIIVPYHCYY